MSYSVNHDEQMTSKWSVLDLCYEKQVTNVMRH